jgi:hypothetical protein
MMNGVACHKISVNEDNRTVDYIFPEVNSVNGKFTKEEIKLPLNE